MGSSEVDVKAEVLEDEELYIQVLLMGTAFLPFTLKAVIELGVFEIMVKGCAPRSEGTQPVMMTAHDIAVHLPTKNPQAGVMLDRMLALLASYNIVKCSIDEKEKLVRRYGPAPPLKWLTTDENGRTSANLFRLPLEPAFISGGLHIKEAVLEGGVAFEKAHGMTLFEYTRTDSKFSQLLNKAMKDQSMLTINNILEIYKGFKDVQVLVDVGGGVGASLGMIVAKYPHIKGINLDLPHVISNAPHFPGVEHVAGDMFASIPPADAIFLKFVLHNWNDENCVKILKNCYMALPDEGKVIVVDHMLPVVPEATLKSQHAFTLDIMMLTDLGSKQRNKNDLEALAKEAGFTELEAHYFWANIWITELKK